MIAIPPHLEADWHRLGQRCREHVEGFLSLDRPAGVPQQDATARVAVVAAIALPPPFSEDLTDQGSELRAAFPQLRRTLSEISRKGSRITVRIVCEGDHAQPFYGLLLPTHRPVKFIEEHNLQTRNGQLSEDRVAIDVAGIIRQLQSVPVR